jgi:TonB family protein
MLLALLTGAAAVQAPAPPVAATDAEQWALVSRVNSVAAYQTYLRRFPVGENAESARQALLRSGAEAAAPALPPSHPPFSSTTGPDRCGASMQERPSSPEVVAYQAARRGNRLVELRLYAAAYPEGACTAEVERLIAAREARRAAIVAIPGLGPLPPHRLARRILSSDDYPASAIRAEASGVVAAEWEIAEDGVPEGCRIAGSSGSSVLDAATCRLITRRMTYDPARDAAGNPVRAADRMTVRWILPEEPTPPPPPPVPPPRPSK